MTDLVIGIDAGTSVIKAVAFDLQGGQVATASVPNRYLTGADGSAIQSMAEAWADCALALRTLGQQIDHLPQRVAAVAVTGQGDGTWLVDRQNKPIAPAWLWLDARAASTVQELSIRAGSRARFEATGTGLNTCQQGSQLAHMARHYPELLASADCALHCKDWLYLNLTGQRATDPSEASFTFGNFRSRAYDDEVIAALGLERQRRLLPPILDGSEQTHGLSAAAAAETGLLKGTPVSLGYVDMVMTSLAAGVLGGAQGGDIAASTVGSTGVHMRAVPASAVHLNAAGTGYVICLPVPGMVTQVQTNMAAALNLDWVLKLAEGVLADFGQTLTYRDLVPHLDRWLGASRPGQMIYHPYISDAGERGPFVNADARASFAGLTLNHSYPDLVRGVAEGLGHAMRDCYAEMGPPPSELRLTGGAARSAQMRGIFAASVGAPVRISLRDEAGAAGAAMMATVAVGAYADMRACIDTWVTPLLSDPEPPDPDLTKTLAGVFPAFRALRLGLEPGWAALSAARQSLTSPTQGA